MSTQSILAARVPVARFEDLVTTAAGSEVLVYDTIEHHIHQLNATTAAVWRLCDGRRTVDEVARLASAELDGPVDADTVRLALTKLSDAGLFSTPLPEGARGSRMSRRSFMQRSAVAGAIAVPALVSISAPVAAAASKLACGESCVGRNDDCNIGGCSQCGAGPGTGSGEFCCTPAKFDPCDPSTHRPFQCGALVPPFEWNGAGMPIIPANYCSTPTPTPGPSPTPTQGAGLQAENQRLVEPTATEVPPTQAPPTAVPTDPPPPPPTATEVVVQQSIQQEVIVEPEQEELPDPEPTQPAG